MPRFGLSFADTYDQRQRAPQPDPYGRRPRHVEAVRIVGEEPQRPLILSPFFIKLTLSLTAVAAVAVSIAAWRLFTFPH